MPAGGSSDKIGTDADTDTVDADCRDRADKSDVGSINRILDIEHNVSCEGVSAYTQVGVHR